MSHRRVNRRWRIGLLVGLALAAIPMLAAAHPLGNFTINHYAGIRVGTDAITLDAVIDMAEIPTFQERQRIDTDRDGIISEAEATAERTTACQRLAVDLHLQLGGSPMPLQVTAAGLFFPSGAGGLSTMRLVCEYRAAITGALAANESLHFEDAFRAERIGWREIVVQGDGVNVRGEYADSSISDRLTSYPTDMLKTPSDQRSIDLRIAPGGQRLAPAHVPDAQPLNEAPAQPASLAASVPGGAELTSLLGTGNLSLLAMVLSLLLAAGLGALHALSPGHGKTIMAAYLVGSHGTARHAVVLGLVVTTSHTLGVVGLALVTLLAADILPPERVYPVLGLSSGGIVIAIGLWLLLTRWRAVAAERAHRRDHTTGREHSHEHAHGHTHSHEHLPSQTTLSWRALFSLGLAGGLVPSASALLLLLGAIGVGRPAYGLILAIAFGAGMAVVLSGVGILLVHAARLVERVPRLDRLSRFTLVIPWATAVLVLGAGIYLTSQALAQSF